MADTVSIENTGACPVAPLADEAMSIIDAYFMVDSECYRSTSRRTPSETVRHDFTMRAIGNALESIVNRVSFLEAREARGALFQICALSQHLSLLDELITDRPATATPLREGARRLLFSLARYIESGTGVGLDEVGGEYYIGRCLSEHDALRDAVARASAAKPPAVG